MTRRAAAPAAARATALLALLPALLGACASCPPAWVDAPPERADGLYASGSCGEVFVEADARNVALTRAARRLADRLGLDVEGRLSVVWADGRLFVEARAPGGAIHAFDGLELVDQAVCDETTFVLVRLPRDA